jgi:2-dehydropantoate 2-reductase
MRVLVVGAGVIDYVYGGRLAQAGHDVSFLARGQLIACLQNHGLVLLDAESTQSLVRSVKLLNQLSIDDSYVPALVTVRCELLAHTLSILRALQGQPDILFTGNTTGHESELAPDFSERALFGFPATGGVLDRPVIRYVLIRQHKAILGEPTSTICEWRLRPLGDE